MFYLGFSGKMGTGKTTIADNLQRYLEPHENVKVLRLGFAAVLKEEVSKKYKIALEDCYSQEGKQKTYHTAQTGISPNKKCLGTGKPYLKPEWVQTGGFTVRELLQYYGTDITRAVKSDYWVKALDARVLDWAAKEVQKERKLKKLIHKFVIIDDMRFLNELVFINMQVNGYTFRINPYLTWRGDAMGLHQSETALDTAKGFWRHYFPEYGRLDAVSNDIYNFFYKKLDGFVM